MTMRAARILVVTCLVLASGCTSQPSDSERTSFASARMRADQAEFAQVGPNGGTLLVEAGFNTESEASAIVTASVGLNFFEESVGVETPAPRPSPDAGPENPTSAPSPDAGDPPPQPTQPPSDSQSTPITSGGPTVRIWLELDTDDDPDQCADDVRSEPTAFRAEDVELRSDPGSEDLRAFAEIALTAPIVIDRGGSHTVALCASVSQGQAGVRAAAVTGVVSPDRNDNVIIDIDPA